MTVHNDQTEIGTALSTRCKLLLAGAGALSLIAAGWPALDLLYRKTFEVPAVWWLFVLAALAAWMSYFTASGLDRIAETVNTRMDEMREELTEYGDRRESDGHLAVARVNGRAHLTPVE